MTKTRIDPEPKLGCLVLLIIGVSVLIGAGAVAQKLAGTHGGRIALGAAFLVAVLCFFGFFLVPIGKKFR